MKYLVCTASLREIYNAEVLLKNHKHNPELCDMIKRGVEQIIYQISRNKEIIHVITFQRLN